eukprot:tig00000455_g1046.t1
MTIVPAAAAAAAPDHDQAAAAGEARGRWIRLAAGACVCLEFSGPGDLNDAEDAELIMIISWGVALKLVAACAAASGAGGLGGLELSCQRSSSCCAGDLLRALAPPAPPGECACAQGALRYLRLTGSDRSSYSPSGESRQCSGLPAGLEDLLRPFPRLEVLDLPSCCTADASAVSALARSLPRLRELQLGFAPGLECAAGLAPLAALEILDLKGRPGDVPDLAPVLEGLAAGPAARSLQRIQGDGELTEFGLRALPRLTALRSLHGQYAVDGSVPAAALAALAACPSLRRVGILYLLFFGPEGEEAVPLLAELLAGFRAALERTTFLHLDLSIHLPPSSSAFAALAALVRAAGPNRLDLSLDLNFRDGGAGLPADPAASGALCDAFLAAPPLCVAFYVTADPPAVAAGRLAALAAFEGCSALKDFEVRLRLGSPEEFAEAGPAAAEAVRRALPLAQLDLLNLLS